MCTWFDITILTIITISSFFGLYGGIIKLIIGLLGFIASIIVTYFLHPYITELINKYLINPIALAIVSGIIAYIISLIICSLVTRKFIAMVAVIRGGMIDRALGCAAGLLRGAIICLLLFTSLAVLFSDSYLEAKTLKEMVTNTNIEKYPNWLQNSIITPYFNEISKNLINILSRNSLELIKLPNNSKKADFMNVPKKSHLPSKSNTKDTTLSNELNQVLDEMLIDKEYNKD